MFSCGLFLRTWWFDNYVKTNKQTTFLFFLAALCSYDTPQPMFSSLSLLRCKFFFHYSLTHSWESWDKNDNCPKGTGYDAVYRAGSGPWRRAAVCLFPSPFTEIPWTAVGELKILWQAPITTQLQGSVTASVDMSCHCWMGWGFLFVAISGNQD